jgi:opacity protein-like surface antigen
VELALSKDTAQFTFRSDSSMIGWGGADLAFSLLYNDDNDVLGQVSLLQLRPPSEQNPVSLGVGAKIYLGTLDNPSANIFALAISGEVRYTFPGQMPMAIYLNGNWAPDITSFSDTKEVLDFNLGYQIEVLPQTTAFIGYRYLEIDTKEGNDVRLDDDQIHIGVRFTF